MSRIILLFFLVLTTSSCKKYLELRPDKKQVVAHSLKDYSALLDGARFINIGYPDGGEIASDNLSVTTADYLALPDRTAQNLYTWNADVFNDNESNDWTMPYQAVLYANTVLEGLQHITPDTESREEWNRLRGAALFFRGLAYFNLAQEFCAPYNAPTAATDPGIVLRATAAISEASVRASVQATYDRIRSDLREAATLLPAAQLFKTRPNKAAAFAALARTALSCEAYGEAKAWCDSALFYNNALLDYNTLNASAANPLPRFNAEVLFHAIGGRGILVPPTGKVDSLLYRSYATNDLRRALYFKPVSGGFGFYGSYDASAYLFMGIATDEVYLTRAESHARLGASQAALADLNALLVKRFRAGTFVPYTAATPAEALDKILVERRKELVFRNLRWSDLRRLNKDPRYRVTLKRVIGNQVYTLEWNSPRYTFPIPDNVIQRSGIPQNP
ncbi:MAG: RagB/SusD family nutrient uptake outer membrane protein [Flaviaesturariibacter sp.]|nr:RagB/SusD family nutrient uptake outer membrane protein [Flaviaesturariibacter sp.]